METRTSGSAGGPGKRIGSNPDTAPLSDPTIITWAQGGKTELANLVLLCSRHHHGVHQYEYTIDYAPSGKPTIRLKPNKHTQVA